jgi:ribosomal protein S18 acetylase RimI-like enzyme
MAIDLDRLSEAPRFPDGYTAISWSEYTEAERRWDGWRGPSSVVREGAVLTHHASRLPPPVPPSPRRPVAEVLNRVCRIDQRSYEGTVDAALYGQYFRTSAGARRLWEEALAGRFGRFDGHRSLLLMRDGEPRGQVMACLRTAREGFIGDLAVLPEDRGGTGRALLLDCLWRYRRAGIQTVSLAVTLDNERAFRLYQSLGFIVRYRFPVMSRGPVFKRSGI